MAARLPRLLQLAALAAALSSVAAEHAAADPALPAVAPAPSLAPRRAPEADLPCLETGQQEPALSLRQLRATALRDAAPPPSAVGLFEAAGSDWFTDLFGFAEGPSYAETKQRLRVRAGQQPGEQVIQSSVNGASYSVGSFFTPSLGGLRQWARADGVSAPRELLPGTLRLSVEFGDVSAKIADPQNRNATFQVASQFNCLEFVSPSVTPERGITGYVHDKTQGPACAMACGAATAYRNYFAPTPADNETGAAGGEGQLADRQVDNLRELSQALGNHPPGRFFEVEGGYTIAGTEAMAALGAKLAALDEAELDALRAKLHVCLQADAQVTSSDWGRSRVRDQQQKVTQVFASAASVAYNSGPASAWTRFAKLVLEASYEATFWAAVRTARRHPGSAGARRLFLTQLGGGAFGNERGWIVGAMRRALGLFEGTDLDVRIVVYSPPVDSELQELLQQFS